MGLLIWIGSIVGTMLLASSKGRYAPGWAVAAFFTGPLALIVVALLSPKPPQLSMEEIMLLSLRPGQPKPPE